jgi:uncharacterized membrane protein YcjF (UPF0283 family)
LVSGLGVAPMPVDRASPLKWRGDERPSLSDLQKTERR